MIGLYLSVVAVVGIQGYLLTRLAIIAAQRLQLLDLPDRKRKWHCHPTPLMGGVAVLLTLVLGVLECHLLGWGGFGETAHSIKFTIGLLGSATALGLIGLWDDKHGMPASRKFLLQIVAILPFVFLGKQEAPLMLFGWELQPTWAAFPLILLWLVSCTNFVNLVDGLDGLAGSVSLIACLTVSVLAGLNNLSTPLFVSLVLAGSLIGFLTQNLPPARIFLGDSGSLPLGFLVGALSLEASLKKAAGMTLVVPVVLLCVPIFDTSMAILRRKLNGRRIDQGDREHIHHCLRDRGFTPAQTLCAISAMCAATAVSAVLSALLDNDLVAVLPCLCLMGLLIAGRVFGFNEFVLLTRVSRDVFRVCRNVPRGLRTRLLLARLAPGVMHGQMELWQQMVRHVEKLHGLSLRFYWCDSNTGEELCGLEWNRDQISLHDPHPTWDLRYAVPRENGLIATLAARGELRPGESSPELYELTEMFSLFCPQFPVPVAADREDSEAIHRPHTELPEPHILTLPLSKSHAERTSGGFDQAQEAA